MCGNQDTYCWWYFTNFIPKYVIKQMDTKYVIKQIDGWMIEVLQAFQHHKWYQARLLTKKNKRNGWNTPLNIVPCPEQTHTCDCLFTIPVCLPQTFSICMLVGVLYKCIKDYRIQVKGGLTKSESMQMLDIRHDASNWRKHPLCMIVKHHHWKSCISDKKSYLFLWVSLY